MPSTSSEAAATLTTASSTGTFLGMAFRASSVGTCSLGMTRTASTPSGGSSLVALTAPSRREQTTNPPWTAAATLSGWPSISAAWLSRSELSSASS